MRFLRFSQTPKTPEAKEATVFVFADAAGDLKQMDEGGNVTALATGGGGGSTPGAVVATKATFGFADLTDQGSDLGRSPVAYTLAEGEQLVCVAARCTEAFDDSGSPLFYVSSAASGPFGKLVGPAVDVGPNINTAADGIVGLFDHGGVGSWDTTSGPITGIVETDSGSLALYVFGSAMFFDGATGIVEFTFYTCTPVDA